MEEHVTASLWGEHLKGSMSWSRWWFRRACGREGDQWVKARK